MMKRRIFNMAVLLALVAVMLISCDEKAGPEGGGSVAIPDLAVSFDKNVIQNNGSDFVTLKAYYKGEDISDKAVFFQIVPGETIPRQMESRVFSSTVVGKYSFQVAYQTSTSETISVNVVDVELPGPIADDEPQNTSFVHRTFFNQFTGANCGYCPGMVKLLRETLTDGVKEKVVLAALRTYGGESGFAVVPNPSTGFPYLYIDYQTSYDYAKPVQGLVDIINDRTSEPAVVGISANPVYYPDDDKVIVRVQVKAAVKDEYNVGLWLLQNGYYKIQKDELGIVGSDKSYNYHDNCVRVANSEYLGAHVGYPLGTLEAGQTGEWVFAFDVDTDPKTGWWVGQSGGVNLDKLHFAAFVTTHKGAVYSVVNAIEFLYNQPKAFEYIK